MKHKHSRPFVTQKMEKYILVILGRLFLQKVPYKNCCSSFVTSQWCGLLVIRKLITNDDVLIQSCLLWNMQYELISTLLKRIFYKVKYESKFSNLQARKPVGKILCDMKFNGFQQFNCLGGKILFWKKKIILRLLQY